MTEPTVPDPVEPTPPTEPAPIPEEIPPVPADLAALVAQVQAMQAQLNAAQGIPSNPVGAAVQNLLAHVKARAAAGTRYFEELLDHVKDFDDKVTSKQSDLARTVAADIPGHVEGADYIKQLANNLHKNVLTA